MYGSLLKSGDLYSTSFFLKTQILAKASHPIQSRSVVAVHPKAQPDAHAPSPWRLTIHIKYTESCTGGLPICPICLFYAVLFISVLTHGCLSCTGGYNPILFRCSNCFSFGYWQIFPLIFFCPLNISIFLILLSDATFCILSCMCPACPSISHFARSSSSSYWKMVLEIKIRV